MIKLIIVDDEEWTRDVVKSFGNWEELGVKVAGEAQNGFEALRLVNEVSPEIVITDMKMPGMDGVKLLQNLNDAFPYVRIIVISGYNDFEYTKQAIKSKVDDYILKPVNPVELNKVLQKCVNEINLERSKNQSYIDFPRQNTNREVLSLLMNSKKQLQAMLSALDSKGIKGVLHELAQNFRKVPSIDMTDYKKVFFGCIILIEEFVVTNGLNLKDLPEEKTTFPAVQDRFNFIDVFINSLSELFDCAVNMIAVKRKVKTKKTLYEIKDYIDNRFSHQINLEHLANLFFISKEYLSKAFKAEFGINLMDYILQLRMLKAKKMLMDKGVKHKAVAEAVGYDNLSYFYRVFKRYFGFSPSQMSTENKNSD